MYLNRYIRPGSAVPRENVQFMGVCGGNWKKFWILTWAPFILILLPSLNKCGPFLLGRYSTTMRRECGQECFSYLLSSMWFLAAVWLSPLFGGHIVLESHLIGKLFLAVFWGFLTDTESCWIHLWKACQFKVYQLKIVLKAKLLEIGVWWRPANQW